MDRKRVLVITLAPVLLLVLTVGYLYAQGPGPQVEPEGRKGGTPQAPVGPQAQLGAAFTYQGWLRDGSGDPISSTCDLTFGLWDAPITGTQVGADSVVTGVAVVDGYFGALVNGGGEFGAAFAGEERWLEIAIQCTGDPGYTTLTPRQALTAAPYALGLQPGTIVSGTVASAYAVSGINSAPTGGGGVSGYATATSGITWGVIGTSNSTGGRGVSGVATATTGNTYGVTGRSDSTDGYGVYGVVPATSGLTRGVAGRSDSTDGRGVVGYTSATTGHTRGVIGTSESTDGYGVYGVAPATSGTTYGVYGQSNSDAGYGVYGTGSTGMYGQSNSNAGYGVYGTGSTGVYGQSDSTSGRGVYGRASATSGSTYGVQGWSSSTSGRGVYGQGHYGVYGESGDADGYGVYARAGHNSGNNYGVYAETWSDNGIAVYGLASNFSGTTVGVFGAANSPSGYAGFFAGHVHVTGDLSVGGTKAFKIDHPLDPVNKYLYHYSVESPEVLNQYSGNVTLDAAGEAWVELPAWFDSLNTGFRYQLTCVGGYAPVYIAEEIQDNRFQIAGGEPGMQVSWMVLALRSDPYIQYYGAPVEVDKPADEQGTYLYPELYGQPEELGLDYQRHQGWEGPAAPEVPVPDTVPE